MASFLRAKRERLDPDDFGLRSRRESRRTPGLRREEVAELAGVSVDYVVRLEQARGIRPSADVVEALSGALRLSPNERTYFFDLAQQRPPDATEPSMMAAPSVVQLVEGLAPFPAMVMNHRYDILAWNDGMTKLLLDFATLPPERRNAMWLCVLHPEIQKLYVNREQVIRNGVALLRSAWAAHPEDKAVADLINECIMLDKDFAHWWAEQDIEVTGRGRKMMRHPKVGTIAAQFEVLVPVQDPDLRVLVFRAADELSQTALDRLMAN